MKIKGLPASIWKGSYEVFFRGRPCPVMQVCHHCKYVHHTYFYCANGHVTCVECQTRNKANCEQAPCKTCNSPSSRIAISINLIEDLDFSCGCGFLGTLLDLKIHKASDACDEDCETPPEREDPAVIEYKMDLDELEMVSLKLREDIQTKLDRIRSLYDRYGLEIVDRKRLEDFEKKVDYVTRESELVLEEYQESLDAHHQIRPIVDTLFSPWARKSFPVDTLVEGGVWEQIIRSRAFIITMSLARTNEGHADLYVKASFERTLSKFIGRILIIRHHDVSGHTVNEASFKVLKDGTIGHQGNKLDTVSEMNRFHDYQRVPEFIHRTYLFGPPSRISKLIHVTAAINA